MLSNLLYTITYTKSNHELCPAWRPCPPAEYSSSIIHRMCVIFAYNGSQDEDSDYSLIIASNRDEFYKRPSKNMGYWEEDPKIIGGEISFYSIQQQQLPTQDSELNYGTFPYGVSLKITHTTTDWYTFLDWFPHVGHSFYL